MTNNDKRDWLNIVLGIFNRSLGQTKELLSYLEDDYEKLLELEYRIKNLFIFYCPGDKLECDKILSMTMPDEVWFDEPIIIII
jgi:hypothetical protein